MTETLRSRLDITAVRGRFSSLAGFTFLDAPGGTQVPDEVGEAIARALREASANLGAGYATSRRVGAILAEAEAKAARFLGCEPHEVIFGTNMTSLNFALSRTAGRGFRPGDEILVSSLDHDGGVAPWLELAHDIGLVVRHIELNDDTTLDFADLERKLGPRTRVVAFAWASNAIGTVVDARRVCQLAHEAGALAWVDAVHYAAHEPIDVRAIGADVLLCSPYKFCGPHLGLAYGRAEVRTRLTQRPRDRLTYLVGHLGAARGIHEREARQGREAAPNGGDVEAGTERFGHRRLPLRLWHWSTLDFDRITTVRQTSKPFPCLGLRRDGLITTISIPGETYL